MMSNSRARLYSSHALLWAAVLAAALATASGASCASDSPAPAVRPPASTVQLKAAKPGPTAQLPMPQRVKIANVSAQAITAAHPMITSLIAEPDKSALRDPVLVSVQVAEPFTNLERSASPVIVINGQAIGDSIVPFKERNRVIAILRDGTRLEQPLRVQVGWLGDFERTLSEPVQAQVAR